MSDIITPGSLGFNDVPEPRTLEEAKEGFERFAASLPTAAYPVSVPGQEYGMYGASLPTWLFNNRRLQFHTDFNIQSIQYFMMCLYYLASPEVMKNRKRPRKITIYVSSPGGLVDDGCFLLDAIDIIKEMTGEPVEIVVETRACSMGSLMTQSASPGYLFMHLGNISQSVNMVHSLSYGMGAGKRDAHGRQYGESRVSMANLYRYYLNRIYRTLVEFRGATPGKPLMRDIFVWLKRQMENRDTFMDPVQAWENGMCDYIITNERHKHAYLRALEWRMGFYNEVTRPDADKQITELQPVTDNDQGRKVLEPEEFSRATREVIRLQRESYEVAKKLRDHKLNNAVVVAQRKLDNLREDQGTGPTHNIGEPEADLIEQAAETFLEHLTDEDIEMAAPPEMVGKGSSSESEE